MREAPGTYRFSKMSELWSWMGTSLAVVAILQGLLPAEYRELLGSWFRRWFMIISPYAYFIIPEFEGANMNMVYMSVRTYLSTKTASGAMVSNLMQPRNSKTITFYLADGQRVMDTFEDVKVEWVHKITERNSQRASSVDDKRLRWIRQLEQNNQTASTDPNSDEKRSFTLKINRAAKERILAGYFAHIEARAKEIELATRELQLYTNIKSKGRMKVWEAVPFLHPSTFDSLALDPFLKDQIVSDLDEFVKSEEFYKRTGKAWKRGYLLYGPPGTGKSSMIAAIANKLHYDVYDVELTEVESNADLRRLLLQTSNKSVIVIEDIDCSLELAGQRREKPEKPGRKRDKEGEGNPVLGASSAAKDESSRVTLSGLLNFTDGLWSACGSERIFIFTTNFVSKLDPALLRPGRMDMHISLSYCSFQAFEVLAKNFLQIKDHHLFPNIEEEMEGCAITPAEVAEVLTQNKRNEDVALEKLLQAIRTRNLEPPRDEQANTGLPNGKEERMKSKLDFDGPRTTDEILRPRRVEREFFKP